MKLNQRPNKRRAVASISVWAQLALALPLLPVILTTVVKCVDSSPPNETSSPKRPSGRQQQFDKDVRDLRLISDFRAVKLRWSYEHNDANEPAAFNVRYCELTSWNVEIKCRLRDLEVEGLGGSRQANENHHQRHSSSALGTLGSDNSVIKASVDSVYRLDPPHGPHYEAQIFDLRALTNYTFQVHVSRFTHEPEAVQAATNELNGVQMPAGERRRNQASARRLNLPGGELATQLDGENSALARRVETKPFGAEATKCLADVSEVVVNTGRYFGGRISVEDSSDPRCNLIGNKSSEQTSYLFRIDHQACESKVVDGNRIETMVLVHENKDILTHNTARFLVLCNFLQKSFTLRASVSLPKVNGIVAHSRPAMITSLARKPQDGPTMATASDNERPVSVMLGSMPGVYRARSELQNRAANESDTSVDANNESGASSNDRTGAHLDELETNTIEKKVAGGSAKSVRSELAAVRQSKELQSARRSLSGGGAMAHARALTLSPELASSGSAARLALQPPPPVQVQSRLLFVERPELARLSRQHQVPWNNGQPAPTAARHQQHTAASSSSTTTTTTTAPKSNLMERSSQPSFDTLPAAESSAQPPGRQHTGQSGEVQATKISVANLKQLAQQDVVAGSSNEQRQQQSSSSSSATSALLDQLNSPATTSIIMTNNHRVSGEFPSLAQAAKPSASGDGNNSYTIKYSTATLDEYPIGNGGRFATQTTADGPPYLPVDQVVANLAARGRSGRMRPLESDRIGADLIGHQHRRQSPTLEGVDNRMGDARSAGESLELATESPSGSESLEQQQQQATSGTPNSSLAHNITSYLLKWSLKTLTNLARKSLESLADDDISHGNHSHNFGNAGSASEIETSEVNLTSTQREPHRANEPQLARQQLESTVGAQSQSGVKSHGELPTRRLVVHESDEPTTTKKPTSIVSPTVAVADGGSWGHHDRHSTSPNSTASQPQVAATSVLPSPVSKSHLAEQRQRVQVGGSSSSGAEELHDGFLTNNNSNGGSSSTRRRGEKIPDDQVKPASQSSPASSPAAGESGHQSRQPHARPSNYSKSLDLGRGETLSLRQRNSERNKVNPGHPPSAAEPNQGAATVEIMSQPAPTGSNEANESSLQSDREIYYSTWPFFGLILSAATLAAILLTLWLVSSPVHRARTSRGEPAARPIHPISFDDSTLPAIVFNNDVSGEHHTSSGGGGSSGGARDSGDKNGQDSTYQRYDYNKFENYSSRATPISKGNLLPATRMSRPDQKSPSTNSECTSSTSAGSTMLVDENDCKNNEFLFTDHVLINTGSSFGESYA